MIFITMIVMMAIGGCAGDGARRHSERVKWGQHSWGHCKSYAF